MDGACGLCIEVMMKATCLLIHNNAPFESLRVITMFYDVMDHSYYYALALFKNMHHHQPLSSR